MRRKLFVKLLTVVRLASCPTAVTRGQHQRENLDRGSITLKAEAQKIFVSCRVLDTAPNGPARAAQRDGMQDGTVAAPNQISLLPTPPIA